MPVNRWSIEILETPTGVGFRPDVRRGKEGDPLRAELNDLVSWSNRTNRAVVLEAVDPAGLANFGRTIAAGDQSTLFKLEQLPIKYRCDDPPQPHSIIDAAALVG